MDNQNAGNGTELMALISGVPEPKIMEVKRKEITEPIRESIAGVETDHDYFPEL